MAEGDLFTSQKLARARQRLVNLNYFETVNATTAPGPTKDKIIVNIDVMEKPTGLFSIGGGYSSQDSFIGTLDLSQRNFLGRGWEVFVRLRGGAQTQQGQIGFTEPWLFDRPLSAGFDLFNNRRVFTDYTVNSLGGDIRFGHPIGEYSRWNAIYRVSQDTVSDVAPNASIEPARSRRASTYTSLDRRLAWRATPATASSSRPAGATRASAFDFAGVGFGEQWFRVAGVHVVLPPDAVARSRARRRASAAATRSAGATTPCRSSSGSSSAAPTPSAASRRSRSRPRTRAAPRIGGNIQLLGNIEYTVPLFFGIRVAAFFDVGNVWGPDIADGLKFDITDLKQAIGLGRPMGVALRADPRRLRREPESEDRRGQFGNFSFSVGSAF